ncbi:hypothetical protein ABE28_021365 [Peribacillus muralis]|uniref:Uncharacterized protein n=1 Tax=Peribacillus muralis TaxID=264697 RepID=A0A1B3XUK1_9BACI|nr:hypothetical protein ABE28_021365 [Peribacillus muralis]
MVLICVTKGFVKCKPSQKIGSSHFTSVKWLFSFTSIIHFTQAVFLLTKKAIVNLPNVCYVLNDNDYYY